MNRCSAAQGRTAQLREKEHVGLLEESLTVCLWQAKGTVELFSVLDLSFKKQKFIVYRNMKTLEFAWKEECICSKYFWKLEKGEKDQPANYMVLLLVRLLLVNQAGGEFCLHNTTICRCEEVTLETILKRMQDGACTFKGIKLATRAGMGNCQGRTCRPLIEQLLRDMFPARTVPAWSYRAPIRPTLLVDLATEALSEK